ncbi:MAG: Ribokinase [Nitrospira sp.]|jgi:ribokinase|nr:MAG: Ribokinase [Nitrospira sp.]
MVLVVGSSNIDLTATVERLPCRGETVLGQHCTQSFGGKGANQALAARRAGAEVVFLTKLGMDDNGSMMERQLAAQGLSQVVVLRDAQAPTGVAMIVVDQEGDNQIVVVPGSNGRLTPEDIRQNIDRMAGARVLLVQMEIPLETVQEALALAKRQGLMTILNPAPACPLPSELLRMADILTPNKKEACTLAGSADLTEAIHALAMCGERTVVVTCGAEGVLMCRDKELISIPAFLVDTIDSTGAGDAFNGVLACAVAEGVSIGTAIELANAAGALATTRRGAQESMPARREIEWLRRFGTRRVRSA